MYFGTEAASEHELRSNIILQDLIHVKGTDTGGGQSQMSAHKSKF